jgi:hypothetical protein
MPALTEEEKRTRRKLFTRKTRQQMKYEAPTFPCVQFLLGPFVETVMLFVSYRY